MQQKRTTIYNYCTSLSAIWCVMEHWKAILALVNITFQCSITHQYWPWSILLFSAP